MLQACNKTVAMCICCCCHRRLYTSVIWQIVTKKIIMECVKSNQYKDLSNKLCERTKPKLFRFSKIFNRKYSYMSWFCQQEGWDWQEVGSILKSAKISIPNCNFYYIQLCWRCDIKIRTVINACSCDRVIQLLVFLFL